MGSRPLPRDPGLGVVEGLEAGLLGDASDMSSDVGRMSSRRSGGPCPPLPHYGRRMATTAIGPGVTSRGGGGLGIGAVRQAMKAAALESAATYVVRRGLELGYRRATGRELPTARDRDAPFRQVLVWATVTAAALSAATVIVDQVALRRESAPNQ